MLNGSPATVIGAMIVAPLMTPILASTTALVMGTMMLSVRSLLQVGAGVVLIVAISWLKSASYGFVVSFSETSQIIARMLLVQQTLQSSLHPVPQVPSHLVGMTLLTPCPALLSPFHWYRHSVYRVLVSRKVNGMQQPECGLSGIRGFCREGRVINSLVAGVAV